MASRTIVAVPVTSSATIVISGSGADEVARDHQATPRDTIGEGATEQDEDGERECLGAEDQTEITGGAREIEHGEGERDATDGVTDGGRDRRQEEEPVVALAEDGRDETHSGILTRPSTASPLGAVGPRLRVAGKTPADCRGVGSRPEIEHHQRAALAEALEAESDRFIQLPGACPDLARESVPPPFLRERLESTDAALSQVANDARQKRPREAASTNGRHQQQAAHGPRRRIRCQAVLGGKLGKAIARADLAPADGRVVDVQQVIRRARPRPAVRRAGPGSPPAVRAPQPSQVGTHQATQRHQPWP